MSQLRVIISGKVQGVFYRESTREQAEALGLSGWVRNLPDGTVELVVKGPTANVTELLDWCQQGPPAAKVAGLTADADDTALDPGFRVRR